MTSRSNRAPDFASEVRTSTRSVAPATSSSRLAGNPWARVRGGVSCHERPPSRPAARPASGRRRTQCRRLIRSPSTVNRCTWCAACGTPALDPAQVELDGLAAGDRAPDRGLDGGRCVVPTGQLGRDGLGAVALEPPVRDRRVERASSVQVSMLMPRARADLGEEAVDGVVCAGHGSTVVRRACSDLATAVRLSAGSAASRSRLGCQPAQRLELGLERRHQPLGVGDRAGVDLEPDVQPAVVAEDAGAQRLVPGLGRPAHHRDHPLTRQVARRAGPGTLVVTPVALLAKKSTR